MQKKYKENQTALGLKPDTQNLGCKHMQIAFSYSSSQNQKLYFTKGWGTERCQAVAWETTYSAFERDDYKRCVCIENMGIDHPDCQQGEAQPEPPAPGPEPEPPVPEPKVNPFDELKEMLQVVKGRAHYSED